MEIVKTFIKMIFGLAIGVAAGLAIAGVVLVCFGDHSWGEYFDKVYSLGFSDTVAVALLSGVSFIMSYAILLPLHEAGHLVCGLASGYKFVSFRIFNLTFIKTGGKLRVKNYSIAGTGGQCLLTPPDLPLEKIPTGWYNFGGVLFNLLALVILIGLLWASDNAYYKTAVWMFIISDAILILMNGIPMKISGAGNDGYNLLMLRREPLSKRGLVDALRSNALLQEGVRPKDMPEEWFEVPAGIDYGNQLEVSIPIMAASREEDKMEYSKALADFEAIYEHKKEIIGLYIKEIECEMAYLYLIGGDKERAASLLTDSLRKYIGAYRKVMSSKERVLCAIALYLDSDRAQAEGIYTDLLRRKEKYLLQGEVESDLALMQAMLSAPQR